jgi:hypothetical protein
MELNIKKTLTIFICAIVIATAIALTLVSLFSQKKEINLSIEEKLQIIQSEKIKILKDIERDNTLKILNLSKNVIITDAFNGFQKAYNEIPKNPDNKKLNSIINAIHEKLETSAGFKSLDQAHKGDVNTFLPEDPTSLCLQATYVFKLKECSYPQSLDAYNKWFKEFIEDNKFYDLFPFIGGIWNTKFL